MVVRCVEGIVVRNFWLTQDVRGGSTALLDCGRLRRPRQGGRTALRCILPVSATLVSVSRL